MEWAILRKKENGGRSRPIDMMYRVAASHKSPNPRREYSYEA